MFKIFDFLLTKDIIKSYVALVLVVICYEEAISQNLVPDSSFENNVFIPTNFSEISASKFWNKPSWGTSDLFCKCATKKKIFSLVNVPENLMGYQYSHSGICYAGLFAFSHGQYREYIQTPLSAPLKKDQYYRLTMHISLADYSRASVDQLGVCFLSNKVNYANSNVITNLNPIYAKIENEIGRDTAQWHQISIIYKSAGGESYLLIGSFEIKKIQKTKVKAPKTVKSRINQVSERDAYYYIDDVSLIEISNYFQIDSVINNNQIMLDTSSKSTTLILKNILFKSNEAILLPISYLELDIVVEFLNKNPQAKIKVVGHTDNSGSEKQNKILSEKRAKAVVSYFVIKNIDKNRITYKGFGSSKSIATNETIEGRQKNRRVEFTVIEK